MTIMAMLATIAACGAIVGALGLLPCVDALGMRSVPPPGRLDYRRR